MAGPTDSTAQPIHVPESMLGWMRSNHAGETGAVWIYRGALVAAWHPEVRAMAKEHGKTEREHLALVETLVPPTQRSRLILLWRIMGFGLGALPALLGYRAFCITIEAVETFVEQHYRIQIDELRASASAPELMQVLEACCADEVEHQQDAARRQGNTPKGPLARSWAAIVGHGSETAVQLARRF